MLPLIQSATKTGLLFGAACIRIFLIELVDRVWITVGEVDNSRTSQKVLIRARLHDSRHTGNALYCNACLTEPA